MAGRGGRGGWARGFGCEPSVLPSALGGPAGGAGAECAQHVERVNPGGKLYRTSWSFIPNLNLVQASRRGHTYCAAGSAPTPGLPPDLFVPRGGCTISQDHAEKGIKSPERLCARRNSPFPKHSGPARREAVRRAASKRRPLTRPPRGGCRGPWGAHPETAPPQNRQTCANHQGLCLLGPPGARGQRPGRVHLKAVFLSQNVLGLETNTTL